MPALRLFFLALFLLPSVARAALPTTPTVTATALSVSSINWTWTLSAGTTGYRILSSTGAGNISGDLPSNTSAFLLISLANNTSAAITVEAFNDLGTADAASSKRYTLANPPTGTTLLSETLGQVALTWNANGNTSTTTYNVAFWQTGSSQTVSTQSINTVLTLPDATTYFFAVQAVNGDGLTTGFDLSVSTFLPPRAPFILDSTATFALGVSSINWTWKASTGVVTYQVISTSGNLISGLLPATQLSFTETGLSTNTAYTRFVQASAPGISTATVPLTKYTLAMPTTGLTLLGLTGTTESISWNANTNPDGTNYRIQWWTVFTTTISISSATTSASVKGLFGGGTDYFTVQAVNGDGIASAFDDTYFGVVPSTFFPTSVQNVDASNQGVATFIIPSGTVVVQIASQTFAGNVNLNISVPASVPGTGGSLGALPTPINLQITATDPAGNPVQPSRPLAITVAYGAVSLGTFDSSNLVLARYDTAHAVWVPLITTRDPRAYALTGLTDHLTLLAVLGQGAAPDLSNVTIGPNPLRTMLNPGSLAAFRNLPARARVRIYTYVGELLADLMADAAGMAAWDGRNGSGSYVASGVYLVLIEATGQRRKMRIMVER